MGMTGYEVRTSSMYGIPVGLGEGSLYIDIDRDKHGAVSLNGNKEDVKQYLFTTGMLASKYEGHIWEEILDIESVSTINVLDKAISEGIDVLNIVDVNCEEELAKLEASAETKTNIRNATAKGLMVIIPKDNVNIGNWNGEGYIVLNPNIGEAEYLLYGDVDKSINGGISGIIISLNYVIALLVSQLLIATIVFGVTLLFCIYTIGLVDKSELIAGLYFYAAFAGDVKSEWEIFILYYRAMNGDEEAEEELKNYASGGSVKAAVGKALETLTDALGVATDLVEEVFDDVVVYNGEKFPKGASNVKDVNNAPLTGHYHYLPSGTQLPDGLGIMQDGCDIFPDSPHGPGHLTIYPTKPMTVDEFNKLYKSLPWSYGGKK